MDWKDVEKYANDRGMSVQEAAQALGIKLESGLDSSIKALENMGKRMWDGNDKLPDDPSRFKQPAPVPSRNDSTLANQQQYEQNLSKKLRDNAEAEQRSMDSLNNFDSSGYKNYAKGGEVKEERFSHLKDMLKKHKRANAEIEASNDPMKFIEKNKNMSIKGRRGVAF